MWRGQRRNGLLTAAAAITLATAPSTLAAAQTEAPTADVDPEPPPWQGGGSTHEHTDPEAAGTVDPDGAVLLELIASGAQVDPALQVSFDGSGRAQITSNLVPVQVREIASVPEEHRDEDPHFQGACLRTRTLLVIDGQQATTRLGYEENLRFYLRAVLEERTSVGDIPACVVRPGDDPGDPIDNFSAMLEPFFEQLPRPTPVLNPESAVTGMDTYLQTNRELTYGPVPGRITLGARDFDVTLWAEGAYTVDWGQEDDGDGEAFERITGPHTDPGRNHEPGRSPDDGAITHVYTTVPDGPLTVSVTDYWVVHYSIAGVVDDATIVAELEPVTVPVEVREYQAVIIEQ